MRRGLAAVLVLALTLAGIGRALVLAAETPAWVVASGSTAPICHSAAGDPTNPADPGAPGDHDCCDACALLAPAALPANPEASRPAPLQRPVRFVAATLWQPSLARVRTPRLSQGPPLG